MAVREGDVIAVEAIEGTEALIERAGNLCKRKGWTLLKTASQNHDMRADVPSIAALPDGTLAAHWLARNGTQPYAYGVRVSCSTDGGQSWTAPFWLHDDRSACEHGFVSMLPQPGGQFLAIWLDGRAMESTGDTQLWSRRFDARGQLGKEVLIDKRVCSCCPTSMASVDNGVLAVYRDRSAEEIRDISYVDGDGVRWTRPRPCHVDGWEIPG